jgi:ABC transporter
MIEARGLVKKYGDTVAVGRLTFDVQPGLVTGFLGPNGSGKSTTLRMILGRSAYNHLLGLAQSNGLERPRGAAFRRAGERAGPRASARLAEPGLVRAHEVSCASSTIQWSSPKSVRIRAGPAWAIPQLFSASRRGVPSFSYSANATVNIRLPRTRSGRARRDRSCGPR